MSKAIPESELQSWRAQFLASIDGFEAFEQLFDRVPEAVFSIKDRAGRYVAISQACVDRCGLQHKRQAIGKTAHDIFPAHMADRYAEQDAQLFASGEPVHDNLDLTLFRDAQPGWCISNKIPLHNRAADIIGLLCLSQDLPEPSRAGWIDAAFAATVDTMQAQFMNALRVPDLALQAGLSEAQFERRMKKVFGVSAGQYLMKLRIDAAAARLQQGSDSLAHIAIDCGFCDQSAFSRQFKQVTGMTPMEYRRWRKAE